MGVLRTPDDRFEDLPGYAFEPHFLDVSDPDGGSLRGAPQGIDMTPVLGRRARTQPIAPMLQTMSSATTCSPRERHPFECRREARRHQP